MKNIQISDELHKQLKAHCAERGLLMKFYVENLITNEITKDKIYNSRREEKMQRVEFLLEKRRSDGNKPNTSK